MMRCGALKGSSQIEHAMWELSGVFFFYHVTRTIKITIIFQNLSSKGHRRFFEKLSLYGIVSSVVEQNSRQFARRSIQALTLLPDSFAQKPGSHSRSKRSLFARPKRVELSNWFKFPTSCLQPPIFFMYFYPSTSEHVLSPQPFRAQ
jgi:hypothetical protein